MRQHSIKHFNFRGEYGGVYWIASVINIPLGGSSRATVIDNPVKVTIPCRTHGRTGTESKTTVNKYLGNGPNFHNDS
jgi:hypothetical protein